MMNPYLLIGLMIAWLASLAGAGWFGYDYSEKQYAQAELVRKLGWAEALEATAKEIAKVKISNKTIYQTGETIIKEKTILQECKNPPEMVQQINAALKGGAK